MRLSNKHKTNLYDFINSFIILIVLACITLFFLDNFKMNILGMYRYLLLLLPILIIAFHLNRGRQIFEYDSDGEALHFRNRNVLGFLKKPLSDEFPKYKLINFETFNLFFIRKLFIKISSKNNGTTILKYDISYLTSKEVKDLKFSLSKVVKENKEKAKIK